MKTTPSVYSIIAASDVPAHSIDVPKFWSDRKLVDKKDDYAALRDCCSSIRALLRDSQRQFFENCVKNLALWLGLHYSSQGSNASFSNLQNEDITVDTHKFIVNDIYDISRSRYSKITRNSPQISVNPTTSEYGHYADSVTASQVLSGAREKLGVKNRVDWMVMESFIFGESWLFPTWNRAKGRLHPEWESRIEELRSGKRIELRDSEDNAFRADLYSPLFLGDHDLQHAYPWEVWLDPKMKAEDVEWMFVDEVRHMDELLKDYPKKAAIIKQKAETGVSYFDVDNLNIVHLSNCVRCFRVKIRPNKNLAYQVEFYCTEDFMLEEPSDSYSQVEIVDPIFGGMGVRMTDVDVPGRLRGYSTINILENLQHTVNQMATMSKHHTMVAGIPKWAIPEEGNINIDELSDDSYAITYSNDAKPSFIEVPQIPASVKDVLQFAADKLQKMGDLHGVSQGDLPNSVRAAKAIRVLQEIEDLRATSNFNKYNDAHLAINRALLLQMKNYEEGDNRLLSYVGDNKEYIVEDFSPEIFARDYRVALEITGTLPPTPSARAEFIMEAYQAAPGAIGPEKFLRVLGLRSEREFLDAATVAVVKAARENDKFIKGKKVLEPEPFENHLVELEEHYTLIQSPTFSMMPQKLKDKVLRHVAMHEFGLFLKMQASPAMKQLVLTTKPNFPVVMLMFEDPPAQPQPAEGGQLTPGQVVQQQQQQAQQDQGPLPQQQPVQ